MQEVHTRTCLVPPPIAARTRRKFGFQRRRVTLLAWLMLFPKLGFLPQSSHTIAITHSNGEKSHKVEHPSYQRSPAPESDLTRPSVRKPFYPYIYRDSATVFAAVVIARSSHGLKILRTVIPITRPTVSQYLCDARQFEPTPAERRGLFFIFRLTHSRALADMPIMTPLSQSRVPARIGSRGHSHG
jgi:hypothetical protein